MKSFNRMERCLSRRRAYLKQELMNNVHRSHYPLNNIFWTQAEVIVVGDNEDHTEIEFFLHPYLEYLADTQPISPVVRLRKVKFLDC